MESFLQECKRNLENRENSNFQVVLGNESCDLDSAVSSLILAYYLFKVNESSDLIIPVLNVKRQDLQSRTEVVYLLKETKIPLDDLICIDDIDLKSLHKEGKLSLVLVDHNMLSVEQSYLEDQVIQVIDHHAVDNPNQMNKIKNKIEPVGSCCTLVAEEILNTNPSLMDPTIAMLLYGTIILDTIGLSDSAKRVTDKDKEIASKLETFLEGISREELFETLQKVKFDTSNLTPDQLLYKDLKYLMEGSLTVGFASLPMLLENIIQEETFVSSLSELSSSKKLNSIILMGLEVSDEQSVRRQIAIYDKDPHSLKKISNYLVNLDEPSLDLEHIPQNRQSISLYEQLNISLTRKFVLPAMRTFLKAVQSDNFELSDGYNCSENGISLNTLDDNCLQIPGAYRNYKPETIDCPDSPRCSMLENAEFSLRGDTSKISDESKDIDSEFETPSAGNTSTLKRIAVKPFILETQEDEQRSMSSLSHNSDLDIFSHSEDIILDDDDDDDDVETLDDLDCDYDLDDPLDVSDPIEVMSAAEEFEKERSWKTCTVNGEERKIDMKVIEPYRKVLSHGGYQGSTHNAIIVFSACYLPDRSRNDYDYVMDNLFLYVITTLDELVAEDYCLVYLQGATERSNMPGFGWLKRCYQMIDRRLRKNLKGLYLVHPTFWLKTIVIMTRPFISSKFTRKLRFVYSLKELSSLVPLDYVSIPDKVKQFDDNLSSDD